jgi:surface antigen
MRAYLMIALVIAAAAAAVIGTLPTAAQAQMGYNLYRSGVELTTEDQQMMRQGIREVLESREVGTQSSWRNPETGVSGVAELTRTYEDNGTPCGSVSFQVQGRNRAAPYNMNFCQMPDGGWGIAP